MWTTRQSESGQPCGTGMQNQEREAPIVHVFLYTGTKEVEGGISERSGQLPQDETKRDLQQIISDGLEVLKKELGSKFSIQKVNLSRLSEITGISRAKLRKIKKDGFVVKDHARLGTRAKVTRISPYAETVEDLLRQGCANASVILERIRELGYTGGLTQVKKYVREHKDLVPAPRRVAVPQADRTERYETGPGECIQMDWGFVGFEKPDGSVQQTACLAMVCHHCGMTCAEFFTNASQDNLLIGMIHGFEVLAVPTRVLTDNMKSVVDRRDASGRPIWNERYSEFMKACDFRTSLCKTAHPFTKGKVERLVGFVKHNFAAGRQFHDLDDLNTAAREWCGQQARRRHAGYDFLPWDEHHARCMPQMKPVPDDSVRDRYLYQEREVAFDGYVSFEGRRFGVPCSWGRKKVRVARIGGEVVIRSLDLDTIVARHKVTWSLADSPCEGQFRGRQPEERPTAPVLATMVQQPDDAPDGTAQGLRGLDFDKEVQW